MTAPHEYTSLYSVYVLDHVFASFSKCKLKNIQGDLRKEIVHA
jgi:hypothetical protein